MYSLLNLAYGAQHNVYEIYLYCCTYQQFTPFIAGLLSSILLYEFIIWLYLNQFIHVPADGHVDCFQFLTIINTDVMSVYIKSLCGHGLINKGNILVQMTENSSDGQGFRHGLIQRFPISSASTPFLYQASNYRKYT